MCISGLNLFNPLDFQLNPLSYTAVLTFRLRLDNRPLGGLFLSTKSLDQCHCPGLRSLWRQSRLLDQVSRYSPVNNPKQPHQGRAAREQLAETVRAFGEDDGPMIDVLLDLGGAALWARITNRSRRRLALADGSRVYALIKAVALDSHGFGRAGRRPRFLV